jgi:hypothetical protein
VLLDNVQMAGQGWQRSSAYGSYHTRLAPHRQGLAHHQWNVDVRVGATVEVSVAMEGLTMR